MAEAIFRRLIAIHGHEGRVAVSSAATGDWHVGERADARTIAALEARLAQSSANSHKPPSSDSPAAPAAPSKPTGRKRGGQPNKHQGPALKIKKGRSEAFLVSHSIMLPRSEASLQENRKRNKYF